MQLINRELSWLCFNERVLQEALDETVPLIERMRFLGIYSNNMDEFFRVRVANIRRSIALKKYKIDGYKGTPSELYQEIRNVVLQQQIKFEQAYRKILLGLKKEGIFHVDENKVTPEQKKELSIFFNEKLKHAIFPVILDKKNPFPKLRDYAIYLAVRITEKNDKYRYALIQVPGDISRFYQLKNGGEITQIMLIDDIIRLYLKQIFTVFHPEKVEAYTFKFTRDAELDLDDDLTLSFIEKIEKSLKERKKGVPVRFVYDRKMPDDLLQYLLRSLNLKMGVNTIPGGKYHNFKDFISFPDFGRKDFVFTPQPPCKIPYLEENQSIIEKVSKKDVLLHFPYHRFSYIVDLLREAAIDPKVKEIKINIYRVAKNSEVMNALLAAVFNGKEVTVVMELQARFDEENNLYWGERLKEFGAKIIYGFPNLKVHSKLLQIKRIKDRKEQYITYVGTGNFNEKSARIYGDLALLTARNDVSQEVSKVFRLLENHLDRPVFRKLLVSPFNAKRKLLTLIDREIAFAKRKKPAHIRIKLNNLTDQKMIEKLYQASQAGVVVDLIVRGICCLIPSKKGLSENITVISIVDRYLEHARMMVFNNGGKKEYFITSADFMERNLDKRIEVGTIVEDPHVQEELEKLFDFQWRGSVKARLIDEQMRNHYRRNDLPPFHAQEELYSYYKRLEASL
jgi:polyphosphate kinase